MAAEIGTVTVEVVPKVDAEAIDTIVREAVADALRRLADGMTAKPTSAPADEPRFYAAHEPEGWGVADRETPEEWAYWSDDSGAESAVRRVARDLNENPSARDSWTWSTYGVGDLDW